MMPAATSDLLIRDIYEGLLGKALDIILRNGDDTDKSRLEINAPFLKKLAKLDGAAGSDRRSWRTGPSSRP